MKRRMVLFLVPAMMLIAAACGTGKESDKPSPVDTGAGASHEPITLTMWVPFSGREYEDLTPAFDAFEAQYPWITLKITPGLGENDDKVLAAIWAGNPPDSVMSWSLD